MPLPGSSLAFGKGVSSLKVTGSEDLVGNLRALKKIISLKLARVTAAISIDLLANTQPRVPYDTGQLRASGEAKIKLANRYKIVATGNADSSINADLGVIKVSDLAHVRTIRAEVSYNRMRDYFDIAVYAHEQLADYDGSHGTKDNPKAQHAGTGPKYLDKTWRERKSTYYGTIENAISDRELYQDVQLLSKVSQRRVGRYTVDILKISEPR